MNTTYHQHAIQKPNSALAAFKTAIVTAVALTAIILPANASKFDSCRENCAKLQLITEPQRDDDGDDSEQRFWKPKWQGIRLDARMHIDAGYDHPFVAHEFCNERGYTRASSYRVATAWRTIGRGDKHIFRNGKSSNTAFRYIHCAR